MIWLLDTNVLIDAVRGRVPHLRKRLEQTAPDDLAVSSITVAELWYGAEKGSDPKRKRAAWSAVLEPFEVLPFDRPAAEIHGRIRHAVRKHPIGERDLLIAAIALANDLVVVTHNVKEYSRVNGLEVEDWTREI